MIRVAVIGAGSHSRGHHLPALKHLCETHPSRFAAAAVCDLNGTAAEDAAREYGFTRSYLSVDDMLREIKPDACIAVTPVSATADVCRRIAGEGIPLLMEKPPGRDIAEARRLIPWTS